MFVLSLRFDFNDRSLLKPKLNLILTSLYLGVAVFWLQCSESTVKPQFDETTLALQINLEVPLALGFQSIRTFATLTPQNHKAFLFKIRCLVVV